MMSPREIRRRAERSRTAGACSQSASKATMTNHEQHGTVGASTPDTGALSVALIENLRSLVREELRSQTPAVGEWVDQSSSPLGRRLHTRAWRDGRLRGWKVGRRIFATRADVARFIEQHGIAAPSESERNEEPDNPIDQDLAALGFSVSTSVGEATR
jgi:hypothetical protein